jgi:parallel beta-helix repeat protein
VKNNTFKSVRRYSVIVRSTDGVIVDNDITGSSNSAITLLNEPQSWANGLHSERVLIARNKISASTFDGSASAGASIAVNLRGLQDTSPAARVPGKVSAKPGRLHRDIRIEDNIITDWSHCAILLRSATGCTVSGNVISASPDAKFVSPEKENIAILVDNTAGCTIAGNDITGDRRLASPEQRITVTDSDGVTVTGNKP